MSRENQLRIQLAIHGYLREFEKNNKLSNIFPEQLKNVIIMLYPRNKFKFIDKFKISEAKVEDDGAKLVKMDDGDWVECQIGDFFDINDKLIYKITLKSCNNDGRITGFNSIGFITKEFTDFIIDDYNRGDNGSTYISSNGYFMTSKCFDETMKNHATFIYDNEKAIDIDEGWYDKNDLVMMKIDTSKMKAIVWNSTPPRDKAKGRVDMDVDAEYGDYTGFYFKFDLPKDIPVAMFIELGCKQTVEIVDHVVKYIK